MWSGGRALVKIAAVGGLMGSLGTATGQTPLCGGQHPGNPELISGAASCVYNEVGGIGQTLINLNDTSVIRWNHLGLGNSGSSLTFQWTGAPGVNQTVVNRVTGGNAGRGGSAHTVAGTIEFLDGNLVIVNPNSAPTISGTIASRGLLFATQNLDPAEEAALLNGQPANFTNAVHPLTIRNGRIEALQGDVVLAGRSVLITGDAADDASEILAPLGNVRVFGGESFRLAANGRERLSGLPGAPDGSVVNAKRIQAGGDVEIRATRFISNSGAVDVPIPAQRVFLRVDDGMGSIVNEGTGLVSGIIDSNLPVTNDGRVEPDEGDSPSGLSTGISRFPSLSAPGQKKPGSRQIRVVENAPVTASASAQRQRSGGSRDRRVASTSRGNGALARGRTFFGLRGGTSAKKKR